MQRTWHRFGNREWARLLAELEYLENGLIAIEDQIFRIKAAMRDGAFRRMGVDSGMIWRGL